MPISPFVYSPAPGWAATRGSKTSAGQAIPGTIGPASGTPDLAGTSARPEEEFRAREKQAWDQGFREGIAREQAETEAAKQRERAALASALHAFANEREGYFRHVEGEVVSLALAIVRKILHREAQVDPLLLTGLVRVALEKVAASQNVRLRVHPSQIPAWQDYFLRDNGLATIPELSGDAAFEPHQCRIETELGDTDLSLETQLKEIEEGLLDLLARRPAPHEEIAVR